MKLLIFLKRIKTDHLFTPRYIVQFCTLSHLERLSIELTNDEALDLAASSTVGPNVESLFTLTPKT